MNCQIGLLFTFLPVLTSASFRIIGGGYIDIREAPYQVFLENHAAGACCGGAIINSRTILTAAHCVKDVYFQNEVSVTVGSNDHREDPMSVYRSIKVIPHPNYDEKHTANDIAIVILEKKLNFSATVQPVKLPARGNEPGEGTVGIVTGWGVTDQVGNVSPLLKYAKLKTISQKTCEQHFPSWRPVDDGFFCAVSEDKGHNTACFGDSGGPFVTKGNIVAGLVSWGYGCEDHGKPTVYTKVEYYLDFINTYSQ